MTDDATRLDLPPGRAEQSANSREGAIGSHRLPLRAPAAVAAVDLEDRRSTIGGLDGYTSLFALARFRGVPVGTHVLPVRAGGITSMADLRRAAVATDYPRLLQVLLTGALVDPERRGPPTVDALRQDAGRRRFPRWPSVTVVVCTRDRPEHLRRCLRALTALDYDDLEVVVVDNAPATTASKAVAAEFPSVRYVEEPRPGLDWARNRGVHEARGEIVAFTDDDVSVDEGWARALAAVFAESPHVMAVTGLVLAAELETEAQLQFEEGGGFGRGFERRWHRLAQGQDAGRRYGRPGELGTGANMAYRRSVFGDVGLFDTALDVGTRTNGGGDLEMFFRVLAAGHTLVYEPRALVWHHHRRTDAELRAQLENNGIGHVGMWVRAAMDRPDARRGLLGSVAWYLRWEGKRLVSALVRPRRFPASLAWVDIRGVFRGVPRYAEARRAALEIEREHGPAPYGPASATMASGWRRRARRPERTTAGLPPTAVRTVDVAEPLQPLGDLERFAAVKVVVFRSGELVGDVTIRNGNAPVGVTWLADAIATLGNRLLASPATASDEVAEGSWGAVRAHAGLAADAQTTPRARPDATRRAPAPTVSVIVSTYDRPDDLRRCLEALHRLDPAPTELMVVDNHPSSGLTPPVVAEFPDIVLVQEPRQGLSYARNAGILAASGDILVSTDDDAVAAPDWLARLTCHFERADVGAVCGNVLPIELETPSQQYFELYGGLGRGFASHEYDAAWLGRGTKAPQTWTIGAAVNLAVRASAFADRRVGLFEEGLGPGTPTGVGEDTYLFYRLLRAGYTIAYEPTALVWHRHRRDPEALRRQLRGYSRGHVSYLLTTLVDEGDLRALNQLLFVLPSWHVQRALWSLRGWTDYPRELIAYEALQNLTGPWWWIQGRRYARRLGRSADGPAGAPGG